MKKHRCDFELPEAIYLGLTSVATAIESLRKPDNKQKVHFSYVIDLPKQKERKHMPLELTITNEQKVTVHLAPVTATGKPAKLDGVPAWEVNSGPATVVPAADGMSADLVSSDDDLSDTVFQVNADADLGSGVETISDTILIHVQGAKATSLGLTADEPAPKTP